MKLSDILILAAAAGFAWWLLSARQAAAAGPAAQKGATLIREWAGWRYYSDGTVIGPDGSYYYQGDKIWNPDGGVLTWEV